MNRNWKLTAAFGAAFILVSAVYFFSSPPSATLKENMDPRVIEGLTSEQVAKIEVDRKGSLLSFEKATDLVGEHWRMVGPTSHAAEAALVQQMLFGLDRFLKAGALDPGKPETAPDATGLNDPRLSVTFVSAGRRDVLRFGKSPMTNSTVVFYQHDGDPKIYTVSVDTFEAFNKPLYQYRAKTLARYPPHRVNKVTLEFKFLRPQGKDKPPLVEYEKSVMERFEEGAERGWYLTQPHRERLNDHAVAALVTELSSLPASDYQPAGDPKAQGFDEPQAKVGIGVNGAEKPIEIVFGATTDKEKKRWVRLLGGDEVALYDSFRFDELPLERKKLRNRMVFPFSVELAKRVDVEVKDLGKIALERREIKKEGESVSTVKWELAEPAGVRVETERVEAFVSAVVSQTIDDFMGPQDFKQAGLDPAPIRLVVETKEGKKHACGLSPSGFMRKDGVDEIFVIRADFVRMLQRLELNFLNMEMFNIPRDHLREFSFESRPSAQLQPVYYTLRLNKDAKTWEFVDPAHKGVDADPERVSNILAIMNYIKAEAMIARDDDTIQKNALEESRAPSTLKIRHEGGETELYISENKSDKINRPLYWARFKDSKTVFQINGLFVDSLKVVPEKKKEDGEKK
jgi:hypothetical protein